MEYKDYYKILGIDKSASQAEIKKKYRNLAKKYHPDLNKNNPEAEKKFKEINEAYEVLGDEEKRKNYDTFGANFSHGQQFDPSQFGGFTGEGVDFSDLFGDLFGNFSSGGFSGGFNMGDIFGSGGSIRRRTPNHESELEITIKEGFEGIKKTVGLNINGEYKVITVNVPAGIQEGNKVRVKGSKYDIDGNVLFEIKFKEESDLKIDGLDLTLKLDVLAWESALSERVTVETLDGRIKVKLPKLISSGKKIKIPNKGYKDRKGRRGDLFLDINIVHPDSITKEEEELYKKLKEISNYNPRD